MSAWNMISIPKGSSRLDISLLCWPKAKFTEKMFEAPTLVSAKVEDEKLTLRFENTGSGLWLADHTQDGAQTDPVWLEGLTITFNGSLVEMNIIVAEAAGDTATLKGTAFHVPLTVAIGCGGWYRINLYSSANIPLHVLLWTE